MHFSQITIAVLCAMVSTTIAAPVAAPVAAPAASACDARCQTDRLLFKEGLAQFHSAKAARSPGSLVWTDDGCSKSPDKPGGYNFLPSCQRHDFGYRNYKRQGRFNEDNRGRIDKNFKDDLYGMCSKFSGWKSFKGVECRRIADLYYVAVRNFGSGDVRIPKVPGL